MADAPTSTGERPVSLARDKIIAEAKRLEEAVLYSAKGHFEAERGWSKVHVCLGIPLVLFAAAASASFLAKIDDSGIIASSLSFIVLLLSAVTTFMNPQDKVTAHHTAGSAYDALLSTVRIFHTIECATEPDDGILTARLKAYTDQKSRLNESCPAPPRWAYQRAKKGIEDGEASYAVDRPAQTPSIDK